MSASRTKNKPPPEVVCPYCGKVAVLMDSAPFYRGVSYGLVYACAPCDAYVGTHPGGIEPLGRLANSELRRAKIEAHAAFDPLWKRRAERGDVNRHHARGKGYKWLAEQLGLDVKDCHIGMFDVEMCRRVVEVCAPYNRGRT